MDKTRRTLHCACLLGLLLTGYAALAQSSAPATDSAGSVTLFYSNQAPQCTFPAETGTLFFPEEPLDDSGYCKHLKNGGYFLLRNLPSATRLWLVNGRPRAGQLPSLPKYCGTDGIAAFNWWELKTIKEPTSTPEKIRIEDLKTKQDGDVVVPGLRLVGRFKHPEARPSDPEAINCLIIEVSP